MAEQQQQALKAPFPPPPPFYKRFTKPNLAQLRQRQKEGSTSAERSSESKPDIDILSLPPELRYLLPPQPPADGQWRSFSQHLSLHQPETTLTDAGIEQLFPSHPSVKANPAPHLISLARSLLTTFLAIVGILSRNPELYKEKVDDLQTIMYNMHDLINQYRPHQARESLILMMEERVQKMREEIKQIQEGKEKVGKLLLGLKDAGEAEVKREDGRHSGRKDEGAEEAWKRRQRQRWAAIASAVGGESGVEDRLG